MNKPVAYIPATGLPTLTEEKAWCVANATKFDESDIPIYTHPVKELTLTDEEIMDYVEAFSIDMGNVYAFYPDNVLQMIRAILDKAQEK